MNTLVAYSQKEENDLLNGNAKKTAIEDIKFVSNIISKITRADAIEIKPSMPDLKNLRNYDEIYLGYFNYGNAMPMQVIRFLETHDFTGIKIRPFCIHEGSDMGSSESEIMNICSGVRVEKGLAIRKTDIQHARKIIEGWI